MTDIIINYSMAKQIVDIKLNLRQLKDLSEEYRQWDAQCADILI